MNVARRFLFHRLKIRRYRQFTAQLKDVLAQRHQQSILRDSKQP
jgi:hypothetical protein